MQSDEKKQTKKTKKTLSCSYIPGKCNLYIQFSVCDLTSCPVLQTGAVKRGGLCADSEALHNTGDAINNQV